MNIFDGMFGNIYVMMIFKRKFVLLIDNLKDSLTVDKVVIKTLENC